jgi:hypothetical protein
MEVPVKSVALVLVLAFSATAFGVQLPSRRECKAKIANAQDNVAYARGKFEVGEGDILAIYKSELAVLSLQLTCGDIVRGTATTPNSYCESSNRAKLESILASYVEEFDHGQDTRADIDQAKLALIDFNEICAE